MQFYSVDDGERNTSPKKLTFLEKLTHSITAVSFFSIFRYVLKDFIASTDTAVLLYSLGGGVAGLIGYLGSKYTWKNIEGFINRQTMVRALLISQSIICLGIGIVFFAMLQGYESEREQWNRDKPIIEALNKDISDSLPVTIDQDLKLIEKQINDNVITHYYEVSPELKNNIEKGRMNLYTSCDDDMMETAFRHDYKFINIYIHDGDEVEKVHISKWACVAVPQR